ncbi:MAG: ferrous iron transporter B [Coriobacteriales bacterium]|jgi:ferrous iron transport protein B
MGINIALAGNPNCGKTTLFNRLTGENGYVGNWPGVTVEKKQASWRADESVVITDLPGIYSLSPYSPEEVVSRDFLVRDRPDVVINLVDSTNLERSLYLTTQIVELGLPVVVGLNMADLLEKNGDKVMPEKLAHDLGCEVVELSALHGRGVDDLMKAAVAAAKGRVGAKPVVTFDAGLEKALTLISNIAGDKVPQASARWHVIKLFEGDEAIVARLGLSADQKRQVNEIRHDYERDADDDAESIVTMARYDLIAELIPHFIVPAPKKVSITERIDRVVTNRRLGLPIFIVVMVFVYWLSVTTVGTAATDWTNDNLFGDGWHMFGVGTSEYEDAQAASGWGGDVVVEDGQLGAIDESYQDFSDQISGYIEAAEEAGVDTEGVQDAIDAGDVDSDVVTDFVNAARDAGVVAQVAYADPDGNAVDTEGEVLDTTVTFDGEGGVETQVVVPDGSQQLMLTVDADQFQTALDNPEPDPADYGWWVPGIPTLVGDGLTAIGVVDGNWVRSLVLDGIVAGVGAILGFVPQMFVLFVCLVFLEDCGYLARVAFIMDRIFRRFGLSGKSFIPMLISSGCGVPGVMSTKTIENESERRMTVMTTTMVPCSAKLPIIALLMGALVGSNTYWWISPLFYFMGVAAVIISGIMLKKTRWFAGETSPFIMELPAYHLPAVRSYFLHIWERIKSFLIKAGTIIFGATILVWLLSNFGVEDGSFGMVDSMNNSLLAIICMPLSYIFTPQGFGGPGLEYQWQATAMTLTGLIAKENVVSTFAVLFSLGDLGENSTLMWSAFGSQMLNGSVGALLAFGAFNLLCTPCFAAIGTIRRQMDSPRWFWFAMAYETLFAWCVSLMINQFYLLATGAGFTFWTLVAFVLLAAMLFQLFRPMPKYEDRGSSVVAAPVAA